MSLDRHRRLIEQLRELTETGKLSWKAGADEDEFQISFKDNTVLIRRLRSQGSTTYSIDLINAEGVTVESVNDADLDIDAGLQVNTEWFRRMGGLFEAARRNALGADKVLESILAELGEISPF